MRPPGRAPTCFKEYLVEITVIYTSPPPGETTTSTYWQTLLYHTRSVLLHRRWAGYHRTGTKLSSACRHYNFAPPLPSPVDDA